MKFLASTLLALALYAPAQASWYCGHYMTYTGSEITGIVGEEMYGPAIYTGTVDTNNLVKDLQANTCYCVDGTTTFLPNLALVFMTVDALYDCQGQPLSTTPTTPQTPVCPAR